MVESTYYSNIKALRFHETECEPEHERAVEESDETAQVRLRQVVHLLVAVGQPLPLGNVELGEETGKVHRETEDSQQGADPTVGREEWQ